MVTNNKSKVFPDIPELANPLSLLKANYLTVDFRHLALKAPRKQLGCMVRWLTTNSEGGKIALSTFA
jgi:hypothetical protein